MKKIIFVFLLLFMLPGCIINFGSSVKDNGIFKSNDKGLTWEQKNIVTGTKLNLGNAIITEIIFHPQDAKIIYIGTKNMGAYKSFDAGETWEILGSSTGSVNNISVNKKDPNEIYITQENKVVKTPDGGITWNIVYSENRGKIIKDLVVDAYDPTRVYIILESGELIKSPNSGKSWTVEKNFEEKLTKLLVDPRDTRKIYVFTEEEGFFRTTDLGKTWYQILTQFEEFEDANIFKDVKFDYTKPDALIYASEYGILKTKDGGNNWTALELLTPPGGINIWAVAQNPLDTKEIYYTTSQSIYSTSDSGTSWTVKLLPTTKRAYILEVNPFNPSILYLGIDIMEKTRKLSF